MGREPDDSHPSGASAPELPKRSILLFGEPTPVSRAFRQIIAAPSVLVHELPVVDGQVEPLLEALDALFPDGGEGPTVVVATSDAAWRAARVLNSWENISTVQGQVILKIRSLPTSLAIPIYGLSLESIHDQLSARAFVWGDWLAAFREIILDASHIQIEVLRLALLHHCMAVARHRLHMADPNDSHTCSDVHAALRVIQGAALDRSISQQQGAAASSDALRVARNAGIVTEEASSKEILRPFDALHTTVRGAPPAFASLLAVDDRGFWGSPMEGLWQSLGLKLIHETDPANAVTLIRESRKTDHPIRVVFLDIQISIKDKPSLSLLQDIVKSHPNVPVVVFSVDDQFSETVLLKRAGAFAYLNKHSLAEQGPGRDAVFAFQQVRAGVQAALFASLAGDLADLWDQINLAYTQVGSETATADEQDPCLSALRKHMANALKVLSEEYRRVFHGRWQDSLGQEGLSFRQIIRALGVVNDSWCTFSKICYFDPDGEPKQGEYFLDPAESLKLWPLPVSRYFAYHLIATSIRGAAAHGEVYDDMFTKLDAWIMVLALSLKLEGVCRSMPFSDNLNMLEWKKSSDGMLARIVQALLGLGLTSRDTILLPHELLVDGDSSTLSASFVASAQKLKGTLDDWARSDAVLAGSHGAQGLEDDYSKRISVSPYISGYGKPYGVIDVVLEGCSDGSPLSDAQLRANILLLKLIEARVPDQTGSDSPLA